MRVSPIPPTEMNDEVSYVYNEIVRLITRSQGPVNMVNNQGALTGPFPPMLKFPQFGIPALGLIRALDTYMTLSGKVREVVILTVGSTFGARFELFAHEIMAKHFGFSDSAVASLASGIAPTDLNSEESVAYKIACVLAKGAIIPDSLFKIAIEVFGEEGTAELIFLTGAYALLAMILNGYDVPVIP